MPEQLIPFLIVVVVVTVVPGPDIALGLRNSLRGGSTAMWWTGLGTCSGVCVHAAASVVGLSAILAASATAYTYIKIAGAAYLFWLGATTLWNTWRTRNHRRNTAQIEKPVDTTHINRRSAFRQGLISNLLNPKIALLFLTLLPQFISPAEPRVLTSVLLTLVFLAVSLVWWRLVSWLAGTLRNVLARERVRIGLESLTGGVMVVLGARVALEGTSPTRN